MNDLSIVLYKDWNENGRQVYGIRGIGPVYKQFYETWMSHVKPLWEHTDFPWHYITLSEESEIDLTNKWKHYIFEYER